jgi:hypothetical protein
MSLLGVICYVCAELGHLSVDCEKFSQIKGNNESLFKNKKLKTPPLRRSIKRGDKKSHKKKRNKPTKIFIR